MRPLEKIGKWYWVVFGLVLIALVWFYFLGVTPRLPYQDSFASGTTGEWRAYAGNWETDDGAIRNLSEERGAKLITGSPEWSDYSVEADVMLLGQNGDAGLIVRSSDEEDGVDSYSGYYAGLRLRNELVIGRADHGWTEYQAAPIRTPLQAFKWYHLKVVAVGCEVAAIASESGTGQTTVAALRDKECARKGRIGLRSYSAGGAWRRVVVARATHADLLALEQGSHVVDSFEALQTEAGYSAMALHIGRYESVLAQAAIAGRSAAFESQTPTIKVVRQTAELRPVKITVRGNVVLTSPMLYIQDSTGGLAVDGGNGLSLKLGDEVLATGIIELRGLGAILRQATVNLLWSREPAPPLSVTAAQAATGTFDGMYIEVEGSLETNAEIAPQSVLLNLKSGNYSYRAILSGARQEDVFNRLLPHSVLRLRGVCVVDPERSRSLTPFVVFLRSSGDITMISGPPWWDVRHLGEIALALIPLTLIGVVIYTRVAHWRMRAVVEERSRMAREIHDTLAQGFAGIALQLDSVLQNPCSEGVEITPVAMAFHMAQQSRREAHRSIAALRTLHTDEALEDMLRKLLQAQVAGSQVEIAVKAGGTAQRLSAECASQVLRIAQEAVANALQHASPTRIELGLVYKPEGVQLEIVDNGRGFEVANAPVAEQGHFGIAGMKERAVNIKADFAIQSDNAGTRVMLRVPTPRRGGEFWSRLLRWRAPFPTSIQSGALRKNTRA